MTAPVPEYGGCPWPIDTSCLPDQWGTYSDALKDRSVALASSTLARLTGYRVGACPITVRPCRPGPYYGSSPPRYFETPFWLPHINQYGVWANFSCLDCDVACEVALPGPVGRVDEVRVHGQVLPPTDYEVHGNRLVYTGAGECWPTTQNLDRSVTEQDTFAVTYLNAHPVDALGAYAAGILAAEFAKACSGSKCRLPSGVTTIIRQGVTMEVSSGAFPGGLTGIREVDSFITLWNPQGMSRSATVWSPDMPRHRVVP